MRYNLFALMLLTAVSTCQPAAADDAEVIHRAKTEIGKQLVDDHGVRYRKVHTHTNAAGRLSVCGEINAHNQMGGYSGWKLFFYDTEPLGGALIADSAAETRGGQPVWDKTWGRFYNRACVN